MKNMIINTFFFHQPLHDMYCFQYVVFRPYSPSRFFGHPCCFTWFTKLVVHCFIWGISSHLWRSLRIRWTSPSFQATIRPPTFLNHPPLFESSSHGTSWQDNTMTNNVENIYHVCSLHGIMNSQYLEIKFTTSVQHCHDTKLKAAAN